MRLVVISDTHGFENQLTIPECDFLLHCGDFSRSGWHKPVRKFMKWFSSQPATHKIYVAGNHDKSFETEPAFKQEILLNFPDLNYLENTSIELESIKFWGTPYSVQFFDWAFMYDRGGNKANKIWNSMPRDTDIVLSHGPPLNILDWSPVIHQYYPQNAGCPIMRHRIEETAPKLVCIGHIHESRGIDTSTLDPTWVINASIWDHHINKIHKPVVIDIDNNWNKNLVSM